MSSYETQKFHDLCGEVRHWIESVGPNGLADDAAFNSLSLRLFTFQFHSIPFLKSFWKKRGVTPETIEHWSRIPGVPTEAFKEVRLSVIPEGSESCWFESSGTTSSDRSKHFHTEETLEVYRSSFLFHFKEAVLGKSSPARFRFLNLFPDVSEAPRSSLGFMLSGVTRAFGSSSSGFFVSNEQLDFNSLIASLRESVSNGEKVLLLGPAFSFVHLLDFLSRANLKFELPQGSRVMETGGYKGKSRELSREELYSAMQERLGIAPSHIVNEYGMCELGSQFYDRKFIGITSHPEIKHCAPWSRVNVLNPNTMQPVGQGEVGMIAIHDLSNVGSCIAIQTADLGIRMDHSFRLIGRSPSAHLKGCSLLAEKWS